jgi:hypothetical protein
MVTWKKIHQVIFGIKSNFAHVFPITRQREKKRRRWRGRGRWLQKKKLVELLSAQRVV